MRLDCLEYALVVQTRHRGAYDLRQPLAFESLCERIGEIGDARDVSDARVRHARAKPLVDRLAAYVKEPAKFGLF